MLLADEDTFASKVGLGLLMDFFLKFPISGGVKSQDLDRVWHAPEMVQLGCNRLIRATFAALSVVQINHCM